MLSSISFFDQINTSLMNICQLFKSCIQHYALHCSSDGHFSQLIFAGDLVRAYRTFNSIDSPNAINELLINHLISFEQRIGTNVKTLTFFLNDLLNDKIFLTMDINYRRSYLKILSERLNAIEYISNEENRITKTNINIKLLIDHILDTLPRIVFDRHQIYSDLLLQLVEHNLNRINDYLTYNKQLAFTAIGSPIEQSRLINGILIPIYNTHKLLPVISANTEMKIVFLNFQTNDFDKSSNFSIIDHNQQFFSYDTFVYRQFIMKYLNNVNLVIASFCINDTFLFELHRSNISVIDSLDEQTFEFIVKVYQCIPCDQIYLSSENESLDKISTILIDRHVIINQQVYIYLSSNNTYQTLLTCIPTSTLTLTTEKILINVIRLVNFLLENLNKHSYLPVASENDYLKYIYDHIPELKHSLECRRIRLDKKLYMKNEQLLPICIFKEYLLNAIHFLCYIHKIDGVYSIKR